MNQFKSLFLPLAEEEEAVFASVFPLILNMPSAIEGGAAAAAGEHTGRPAVTRSGTNVNTLSGGLGGGAHALTPASSAAASLALYSPAEGAAGNFVEGGFGPASASGSPRESAQEAQARRGAPPRSLIFAVGSARAEALLVVLRSLHVVVFGLDRPHAPPYELYRLRPLPTTQQLQVAREMSAHKSNSQHHHHRQGSGGSGRRGGGGEASVSTASATCASLIPLPISYCCRIVVAAEGRGVNSYNGRAGREEVAAVAASSSRAGAFAGVMDREEEEEEIYLRGLVGSSDGRVSLFSDVAYTLSFAAHETAVAQVDAVLLPPSSLNTVGSRYTDGTAAGSSSSRPGSPTSWARQCSTSAAGPSPSSPTNARQPPQQPQPQPRQDPLQCAMERLGIVTSGMDGVILLWRRLDGAMSPVLLLRPTSFARRVPYAVLYPSALSALLSASAPPSRRAAAIDAELCCPPSCLLHATSQHAHGLRVRQFAPSCPAAVQTSTGRWVGGGSGGSPHSNSEHYSVRGSGAAAAAAGGVVEAAERAAPTWLSLPMPGSWTAAVTAMAAHHNISLIAREATLFSVVHLDSRAATRIWKAESSITQLVLQDTLALAVCAKSGAVHVLTIHPVTGQGVHQRVFYSYKSRPIHHVSLHEASLLMTIVDVCGSTELVQLPSDVLLHQHAHPLHGGYTLGSAECLNLLASMAALRAKVSIEDVKGAGVRPNAPSGATSMYEANAALDQLNERLLLARLAVPEECDRYMAANQHVF